MDKKITRFNIVHGDDEYEIPEECEAAEEAAEELAKTNLEEHYSFINLLSIAVICYLPAYSLFQFQEATLWRTTICL